MRNANGYGTVVCLDKTGTKRRCPWAAKITVSCDKGKQTYKYIGYYKTQTEAQIALAEYHAKGMNLDANKVTFIELFQLWREKNENKLTEKNMKAYETAFNLVESSHNVKLKDIKSIDLQRWMDSVDRKHSSKSKLKSLWNQMYELAVMDDLVIKNYSKGVDLNCKQEQVGCCYTDSEIKSLWDSANSGNVLSQDILILIYTGMRINEALSIIPKKDINMQQGFIECHGTKTESADRLIPIHPDIAPILEQRKDNLFLFTNTRGYQMRYRTFVYAHDALMEEFGFSHKTHDARKTFVTKLHQSDISMEDISAIVGHAQKGITAKVYLRSNIQYLVQKINDVKF